MILYANKKRNKESTLKKRDKVYLLRRNIKMKRSNNKLNHMKLESFEILEEKRLINYKLNLSTFMKIHLIFHISLLKSANLNSLIQTESSEIDSKNQNVEYEVKNILNQQNIKDQSHWLIKWKDYEHIKNTISYSRPSYGHMTLPTPPAAIRLGAAIRHMPLPLIPDRHLGRWRSQRPRRRSPWHVDPSPAPRSIRHLPRTSTRRARARYFLWQQL